MNGLIIDPTSPKIISRMRQIRLFSPSAMLPALEQIKSVYNEYFDDDNPTFRNKGPFPILDKVQSIQIRLQNLLFQDLPVIDAEIKTICTTVVRSHQEALNMKDKLELSIAMLELVDNKMSNTHDHDIATGSLTHFGLDFALRYSRTLPKRMNWPRYCKHSRCLVTKVKYLTLKSFFLI